MLQRPTQQSLPVYFENPVGRLLEHPNGYAIVQYKSEKRKMNELQAFLTHASQLLLRRGWHKLLGDQRVMTAFTEEEQTWIKENWLRQPITANTTIYGAVLIAHDVFARLAMNLIMNEARESALVYRLFDEEADAEAWLLQLP